MKLKDKVALITGSSRGIGEATALLFAKEGARVVVNHSKSDKEVDEVVKKIKKIGSDSIAIKCDVSDEKEVKKMVEKTIGTFGRIVNISSTSGVNSFSTESMDYGAAKAGVIILTRTLAKELAPKILVNSIAPGWIDTYMNKDLPKDYVEKETEKIYLKRFAKPEEVAKAILFLSSDDASYITGITLIVDGGYG